MKYLIILFLFVFISNVNFGQFANDLFYKDAFLKQPDCSKHFLKSNFAESSSYASWDVVYNKLNLIINPEKLYIDGSVEFKIKANSNQLETLELDLSSVLEIVSITSNGKNLNFSHSNDKVALNLGKQLVYDELFDFTVTYKGAPTTTGFGSFVQSFKNNNIPSIETLSEHYGAMEWWPCKQSLMDKIDSIDIIVSSPEVYETASNGILVSNTVKNGMRTCHWKHRYPIATYLVFITTTEYEKYSHYAHLQDGTQIEILNYVFPYYAEEAKKTTPFTADLIELYSELFIDYPFKNEKYGHAQFSWGGGMEHQTMSSMGAFNKSLIAHELAHQWFGDFITCGSWQDIWLNEGFATFLTGLYYEHLDPDPWWRLWREEILSKSTSLPGGSIFVQDTTDIGAIFSSRLSYKKGAAVLHMLRGQLGDEKFYKGMKNYLNDERVVNGFATTDLFRENMEIAADTILTEFFKDWIHGEGFPLYEINCNYMGSKVSVNIVQRPSVAGGPLFEMKIPFSIYSQGKREFIWLHNTSEDDSFTFNLNYVPDSILVDEEIWIIGNFENTINTVPYFQKEDLRIFYMKDNQSVLVDIPNEKEGEISIYSMGGQSIESINWSPGNNSFETHHYKSGLYLLYFESNGKTISTRFHVF